MNKLAKTAAGTAVALMLAACGSGGSGGSGSNATSKSPVVPTDSASPAAAALAGYRTFSLGHTTVAAKCIDVHFTDQYGNPEYWANVNAINTGHYSALVTWIYITLYDTRGKVTVKNYGELSPDYSRTAEPTTLTPGQSYTYKLGGNMREPFASCKVVNVS